MIIFISMRIISIDVGIKNLALCCFEKKEGEEFFRILQWDVLNIGEKELSICQYIEKEKEKKSKKTNNKNKKVEDDFMDGSICGKPAKFIKKNKCYCLKHAKKTDFLIPTNELKSSFINKQKIQKLFEMADKYHLKYDNKTKKTDLIHLLNDYVENICLETIHSVNASKVDIITIGQNIQTKLDAFFYKNEILEPFIIDHVIIENQISPIANRMKTIQGMISQYFIMKGNVYDIDFISSSNKLKVTIQDNNKQKDNEKDNNQKEKEKEKKIQGEKMDYKDRKKAGIEKCIEILNQNSFFQENLEHFQKHKKKDDLADCFLQGYWYISEKLNFSFFGK